MAVNCYALTVTYDNAGQFAQNVFHYKLDDTGFTDMATAARDLCNHFITSVVPALQLVLPTAVTFKSVKARAIDTVGGFEALVPIAGGTTGSRTGQVQASGVCPVITIFPVGNAKARGKLYLCSVTDTDLIDGYYQTAYKNVVAAQVVNIFASLVLTGGGSPTATYVVRQTKPTYSLLSVQYGSLAEIPGTLRKRMRPY